jgi:hypothetical protein
MRVGKPPAFSSQPPDEPVCVREDTYEAGRPF